MRNDKVTAIHTMDKNNSVLWIFPYLLLLSHFSCAFCALTREMSFKHPGPNCQSRHNLHNTHEQPNFLDLSCFCTLPTFVTNSLMCCAGLAATVVLRPVMPRMAAHPRVHRYLSAFLSRRSTIPSILGRGDFKSQTKRRSVSLVCIIACVMCLSVCMYVRV